jgi:hypothetical protein
MCLDEGADMLSRGFEITVSLTLVEFENGETARNVSPLGSRSRAVPILGENQEVKKLGDLTIELARLMGLCTHCKLDKSKCNRVNKDNECGFETRRADKGRTTIRRVEREVKYKPEPMAALLNGTIVRLAFDLNQEQTEKEQATEEGEIAGEPTAERQKEDDELFNSNSGDVLSACTSASSTTLPSSFEGKHMSDGDEQ